MMDEHPAFEDQDKELPRWVQVPAGLILGIFTLLCGFASVSLLIVPNNKGSPSRYYRRAGPFARLPLGTRKVFSLDYASKERRRPHESPYAAGNVLLPADLPGCGLIHWLLSGDGCRGYISSGNVLFRLSGAPCVGSETSGRGSLWCQAKRWSGTRFASK